MSWPTRRQQNSSKRAEGEDSRRASPRSHSATGTPVIGWPRPSNRLTTSISGGALSCCVGAAMASDPTPSAARAKAQAPSPLRQAGEPTKRSSSARLHRIGELAQSGEMEVGLRDLAGVLGSAETLKPAAPLDPAGLVAEAPRHADVVILALGDMQNVVEAVAQHAEPAAGEGKEASIGLFAARLVDGDAVVEWLAQRPRHMGQRPA